LKFDDHELMQRDPLIDKILVSSDEIEKRIRQLGAEITRDYQDRQPILICILKGAFVFLAGIL
jgi:hypoxanthine phosphoribosyltransferase